MRKSLIGLAVAGIMASCSVGPVYAALDPNDRAAEKVEACVQLEESVRAVYDARFHDVPIEVVMDVVLGQEDISDYQRWVMGSYILAVYTDGVKLDATRYWGDFLGVCVNIMGKGTLELEVDARRGPAVNISRRPV